MKRTLFLVVLAILTGCDASKSNDKIKEISNLQSQQQVDAENGYLTKRAAEMEADLTRRYRFYQAVTGTFEGRFQQQMSSDSSQEIDPEINVRFTVALNLPPYQSARLRTLEEITEDLNNLYLNVQVVQWSTSRPLVFGCSFEKVRPDLVSGRLDLVASNCASVYSLQVAAASNSSAALSDSPDRADSAQVAAETSAQLASDILDGAKSKVNLLIGERKTTIRTAVDGFSVRKVTGELAPVSYPNAITDEDLARNIWQMEADLLKRQRFYQAVRGTYEGTLHSSLGEFKIRLALVPSAPLYIPNRARSLEEIQSDLESLYFNVQIVQWNPLDSRSAVGCRIEKVRPDLIKGTLSIASEGCPNFYEIKIDADGAQTGSASPSAEFAHNIAEGLLDTIPRLAGKVLPSTNSNTFTFLAEKQKE
ncbi:hypothetical protein WDW86_07385 [Bdellovibrionota bacterium FG-2]